jgi:bifunctional non-homologous end joining protein LigD
MARAAKKTSAAPLSKYRSMRDFGATPEPSGGAPSAAGNSFVIQKHAATRLHYDFRLELDGVLLSWAIPKGPSTKVGERRLAARTEDHPLDYGGFEGIIPKGQYGGGSVIVWDRGTWQAEGDAREGLKKGKLTFTLAGEKLGGRWHLVRTHLGDKGKETWLLFKGNDEAASDADIDDEQPNSVVSGKSVEEIGASPKKVWLPKNIRLTHPEKVLYPSDGVTKETLAIYYLAVKDQLLPLISHRPLSLYRCPSGVGASCFFQKHAKDLPKEIHRVRVEEKGAEEAEHTYIDSLEGLLALVQMSVLEIHTWGCHADKVDKPDQLVFDLDPDEGLAWNKVVEGAKQLREFLEQLGLRSFLKTTGGKGLHIVVPVERRIGWDEFKAFSKSVVLAVEDAYPDRYTTNPLKRTRKGKIFLDYLRNGRGATAVAPYSTRAREGATVSTPIDWSELTDDFDPKSLTVLTVPQRLASLGNQVPWHDYNQVKQGITAAMRKQVAR